MNSRSGPSACSRSAVTTSRPRCQVVITVNAATPISSGSHAPWTTLVRLAATNIRSTKQQGAAADHDEPQRGAAIVAGRRRGTAAW